MNKNYTVEYDLKIILRAIVIVIIGQISYMNSSNGLVIVALLVCAFLSCMISSDDLFVFMLCVLPANRLLTYGSISAPTIIMLVALIRKARFFMCIRKKIFTFSAMLIGYSVLTIFGEASVFFDSIKIVVMLLFIYKFVDVCNIKDSYYRYTIFCSIGCICTSLIALLLNPASLAESSRFTFSKNGENVLGIMCAVMAINLFVILIEKENSNRLGFIILAFFLLGIGFLTGSRSFMLAAAIGVIGIIIMLILRMQVGSLVKIVTLFVLGAMGAVFLVKNSNFISDYWDSIMYRITKLQTVDVSNGRYELWKEYLDLFHQKPKYLWLGGLAVGTNGIELVAHNMIIEQIAAYGIIGSVILIFLYVTVLRRIVAESLSRVRWNTFRVVPLIALLCVSMVSHTLLGVPQTIMLLICFLAMLDNGKDDKEV